MGASADDPRHLHLALAPLRSRVLLSLYGTVGPIAWILQAKRIGNSIKEREHCDHVHSFGDLFVTPARITELLNVLARCLGGGLGDELCETQQRSLPRVNVGNLKICF